MTYGIPVQARIYMLFSASVMVPKPIFRCGFNMPGVGVGCLSYFSKTLIVQGVGLFAAKCSLSPLARLLLREMFGV